MFPWLYYWAPQFHYPFSGAVNQDIAPTTDWFFGNIQPDTGDAALEQAVFEKVASYGKQIGVLTDTVLWLAGEEVAAESAPRALTQLRELQQQVESLKSTHREEVLTQAATLLDKLARTEPEKLRDLLANYMTSLPAPSAGT